MKLKNLLLKCPKTFCFKQNVLGAESFSFKLCANIIKAKRYCLACFMGGSLLYFFHYTLKNFWIILR